MSSFPMEVIGIIDLESWNENHFTPDIIVGVMKVALDIGESELFFESLTE